MKPTHLSILGPQGSGKSEQAKLLCKKLGLCYISIGDAIRTKSQEDSSEGRRVKEIMERGGLVDDRTVAQIFKEKMESVDCQMGFVTDSYPRRLSQVQTFDPVMKKVFYLEVPADVLMERIQGRGRIDDTPEAIATRLDIYKKETQPLLDFYSNQGILFRINGLGEIEEVNKRLLECLNGQK